MSGGFYWYYQSSQDTIKVLEQNNAKLKAAIDINENTIAQMQLDFERANSEIRDLNLEFRKIRNQNSVLSEKLQKHDLGMLAENRPSLVGNIVNRATEKVNRCFEVISGAELTEEEKNAETPQQANSECPWLFTR